MVTRILVLTFLAGVVATGAVSACTIHRHSTKTTSAAPVAMTDNMMAMHHENITTDDSFVYVIRGDQLLKLNKSDLSVVAQTSLSAPVVAPIGRGPSVDRHRTTVYSSGSRVDEYAPAGDVGTPVDRSY